MERVAWSNLKSGKELLEFLNSGRCKPFMRQIIHRSFFIFCEQVEKVDIFLASLYGQQILDEDPIRLREVQEDPVLRILHALHITEKRDALSEVVTAFQGSGNEALILRVLEYLRADLRRQCRRLMASGEEGHEQLLQVGSASEKEPVAVAGQSPLHDAAVKSQSSMVGATFHLPARSESSVRLGDSRINSNHETGSIPPGTQGNGCCSTMRKLKRESDLNLFESMDERDVRELDWIDTPADWQLHSVRLDGDNIFLGGTKKRLEGPGIITVFDVRSFKCTRETQTTEFGVRQMDINAENVIATDGSGCVWIFQRKNLSLLRKQWLTEDKLGAIKLNCSTLVTADLSGRISKWCARSASSLSNGNLELLWEVKHADWTVLDLYHDGQYVIACGYTETAVLESTNGSLLYKFNDTSLGLCRGLVFVEGEDRMGLRVCEPRTGVCIQLIKTPTMPITFAGTDALVAIACLHDRIQVLSTKVFPSPVTAEIPIIDTETLLRTFRLRRNQTIITLQLTDSYMVYGTAEGRANRIYVCRLR